MIRVFLLFTITLLVYSCSLKQKVDQHGLKNLNIKKNEILVNISNKNDIIKILGHPSTKSLFDNSIWIYLEKEKVSNSIFKMKSKKIIKSNVLVLELNNRGILIKKDFYDMNDINKLDFSEATTEDTFSKRGFVYDFLSSMRQKINDPLNKRKKR
jgi:outer membrane protein assembly factor BamE (lipoprotein component of BamABCDE complex)